MELGYKIKHIPSGKYKHRAGGTLWSDTGDIYYSLKRAKAVVKSHLRRGRKWTEDLEKELVTNYQIEEFNIIATGKIVG